jgi:pimeloyl-ACP methyl ester carboxylesterase
MTSDTERRTDSIPGAGFVQSRDGTRIGYRRLGSGPPLVVCHGSFAAADDWLPFAEELAATHSVVVYDRRGRASSPRLHDAADSSPTAELDDLAAVVEIAGDGAALLGHSFGGGCVLAYAALTGFAGPVIAYEPRHAIEGPVSADRLPEIRRVLAADGREPGLRAILETVIGLSPDAIRAFEASPLWARMLATVDAFPDEVELLDTFAWRSGDLDGITGPTWLLVGENSPILPADREGSLRGVLPRLRRITVEGQGHFGYTSAPAVVARAVRECLEESRNDD